MVEYKASHLDAVFHALSDPTRRAIIGLLAERPRSISELVQPFSISFAAISKHVKSLEYAGLIHREVQGRVHVCELNSEAMRDAYRWLGDYEKFWNARVDALEAVLLEESRKRNGD